MKASRITAPVTPGCTLSQLLEPLRIGLRSCLRPVVPVAALVGALALAQMAPAQADLIHNYTLDGTLADSMGGPSLVSNGGTLNATNYSFDANQGLTLTGALTNTSTYSILTDFSFAETTGYRRIVDFKNSVSDTGVYNLDTQLNFFGVGSSGTPNDFMPNTLARLVLTRDAGGQFTGYVNGVQRLTFLDNPNLAVSDSNILKFFIDDNSVRGEASAGFVDNIAIYDNALSSAEVLALGGPSGSVMATPEPSTWAMMFLGMGAMVLVMRRKREVEA